MREKNEIERNKDIFSGVIIDAHILETFPNAAANFLAGLQKPFIIDPITYRFSIYNNIDLFAEKRWYPILQSYFFADSLGEMEQLTTDYFSKEDAIKKYVNRVVNYQRVRVKNLLSGLEVFGVSTSLPPIIIIPPYSIIMNKNDPWLNVNVDCVKEAISIKKEEEKIYAVISIFKDLLHNNEFIDSLISSYAINGLDGYFIWVADFKEEREDENCLKKYLEFFNKLSKYQKPIINFYGGFLSMVAASIKKLSGFSFALCYAEHRNPFSEGGPMPTTYYLKEFHSKMPTDEVNGVQRLGGLTRCTCSICQNYRDIESINLMHSIGHFINSKRDEMVYFNSSDIHKIINDLNLIYTNMKEKDKQHIYISHYRHIERWVSALNNFKQQPHA